MLPAAAEVVVCCELECG